MSRQERFGRGIVCPSCHANRLSINLLSLFLYSAYSTLGDWRIVIVGPRQVTHIPHVLDILFSLAYTPGGKDQRLLVYLPKNTGNMV